MKPAATEFWTERTDYHDLARAFEENIELNHPDYLTGRSPRGISFCNCSWCAQRVEYPSYDGPRVTSL